MSGIGTELRDVSLGLWNRVVTFVERARRMTPGPTLVRIIAGLATLSGLALALPATIALSPGFVLAVPIAVGVALFPRTRWVSLVLLAIVGAWLVTTIGFETEPPRAGRVGLLAAALYVAHSGATLASVLPFDSVVGPAVLWRWVARTAAVLGASVAVGLLGMVVLGQLRTVQSIIGPIVGSIIAAALAGLLAWHVRRRA